MKVNKYYSMKYTHRELWTLGRRGGLACIRCTVYEDGKIHASAEADKITPLQMSKVLMKEFGKEFQQAFIKGNSDTIYMDSLEQVSAMI